MINLRLKEHLSMQFIKFVLVGIGNTIIGLATFYMLTLINFHYSLALAFSYLVGMINSFIWNKRWTFDGKGKVHFEIIKFVFVNITAYGINLILMFIFIEIIGIIQEVSVIITLSITTVVSFIGHKFWSFK